ncbi:MAG: (p)ppGpp synthetase [Spirochaetes bacterium GWD1_61_31]|nr:MAG: (p)ppGpp synthetase [Spirochaetes bacterium GWB1_60_80]OHD31690.1 MAG: (p)ppGpp synthetase [Spirochaetes bacterium GWC1_61_12]OHD41487.1 MAG: (p)ppGpp synthetase [Spirochaetes bacterium GWE1_60_18]OHD42410.1 MAG: (p)ppGpp synthetase [Spirochaetes bacterium GWD1_61_31]OHD61389.1 MAG: (p)ppGpp synthetase [Spirochaetes bacterium GWF1_60_12]HAP44522.1 GTP pyrophosphokinase [Spirochaetaceae bacterium]
MKQTEERIDELAGHLERFSAADREQVLAALAWARALHVGQTRLSGEPAIRHPERVAITLADLGMDAVGLIAALLHHSLEPATPGQPPTPNPEIRQRFGDKPADLVEELARIAALKAKNKTRQAAETIRKMLFAMARDLRVILVKLADKLDNMRTIKWLPELERKRIATECLQIFAPLADRLGISWLKDELEDLSLKEINREAFDQIKLLVSGKKAEREDYLRKISEDLITAAAADGLVIGVEARAKHFYSIYQKMRKRAKGSGELYDLFGIRVMCEAPADCYAALGLAHRLWKPLDGRFKDYIAMPKSNGYQSLHTTVLALDGKFLEIQIRTRQMHRIAEFGIASHWLYKKGSSVESIRLEDLPLVNRLKDWSSMLESSEDFLEDIKRELLKGSIIVFTPRGDAIELPSGATPLDFAYAIHSDVGHRCIAAKIDGSIASLATELKNTQVVEIQTSASAHPSVNWLNAVRTSKARSKIRQWLVAEGHVLAIDKNVVARRQDEPKAEERKPEVQQDVHPASLAFHAAAEAKAQAAEAAGLAIDGGFGLLVRFAACCKPIAGDLIVGYVSRGRGVVVHRANCPNLPGISEFAERRVDVHWEVTPDLRRTYIVQAKRTHDLFSEIDNAVKKHGGTLLEGKLEETPGGLTGRFTLSYLTAAAARTVERNLKNVPSIIKLQRVG